MFDARASSGRTPFGCDWTISDTVLVTVTPFPDVARISLLSGNRDQATPIGVVAFRKVSRDLRGSSWGVSAPIDAAWRRATRSSVDPAGLVALGVTAPRPA